MATAKVKPYKELLTTALHRRFTTASLVVLGVCYAQAALLSNDGFIWRFLPFGTTGIRALLLFIPCLSVFIIRLYNLHFGERITRSGFQTFYQQVTSMQTAVALFWYMFAAQLFGVVYIWSSGATSNLSWVDPGRAYERPRLNENPILIRCLLGTLAVVQTALHLYLDIDLVSLKEQDKTTPTAQTTSADMVQPFVSHAGPVLRASINATLASITGGFLVYMILLRHLIWTPTYTFARTFDSRLPQEAPPSGFIGVGSLTWHAVSSLFLLAVLISTSNVVFTVFMAQSPIKKTQPLTNDATTSGGSLVSRAVDANGSLINGLTRKKESPHTFALWELYLICTQFDARRKSIFLEVDRAGGSSWTQISRICLAEIEAVSQRITAYQTALTAAKAGPQSQPAQPPPRGLPRITSEGPKQGDIYTKARPDLANGMSSVARSAGQHPGAVNPLSPSARKAIAWGTDQLISKEQQQQLSIQGIERQANGKLVDALKTAIGQPFRETFARTAKSVIFGTPYSTQLNITHAVRSLAALLKASLTEDTCGMVAKDVPQIIRALLASINSTKQFLNTLQPSWTDVDFDQSHRQVPEVLELIAELRSALEAILLAFGEYASSLGMSKKELREAKEAVGMHTGQEMMQAR